MPRHEVVIVGPDGRTPILVAGLGVAEVSEIEEEVHRAYEKGEAMMKEHGTVMPFDKFRERRGLARREDVDAMTRDAMRRAGTRKS